MTILEFDGEVERVTMKAVDWLLKIRNSDFGWGDHLGWPSTASITSESILGFAKCGIDMRSKAVQECASLLRDHIEKKTLAVTKETRNAALPILALVKAGDTPVSSHIQKQVEVVRSYKLKNEGWPLKPDEKISNILDSTLALRSLACSKTNHDEVWEAKRWLYSVQREDGGWPFYIQEESSNLACTAHATLALIETGDKPDTPSLKKSIEYLLRNRNSKGGWELNWEEDPLHGHGKWFHYNTPFALLVLLESGFDPRSEDIRKAIKCILDDEDDGGGWKPLPEYDSLTWATANALMALGEYAMRIRNTTSGSS